jgi:hypothetical protein
MPRATDAAGRYLTDEVFLYRVLSLAEVGAVAWTLYAFPSAKCVRAASGS